MDRDNSQDSICELLTNRELSLPNLPNDLDSAFSRGHTLQVDGTNVLRVPFGIRQPRRKRPDRPERLATLVLPFQSIDSPNPPPQAA